MSTAAKYNRETRKALAEVFPETAFELTKSKQVKGAWSLYWTGGPQVEEVKAILPLHSRHCTYTHRTKTPEETAAWIKEQRIQWAKEEAERPAREAAAAVAKAEARAAKAAAKKAFVARLDAAFPEVSFSVQTMTRGGYHVEYTGGPTTKEVETAAPCWATRFPSPEELARAAAEQARAAATKDRLIRSLRALGRDPDPWTDVGNLRKDLAEARTASRKIRLMHSYTCRKVASFRLKPRVQLRLPFLVPLPVDLSFLAAPLRATLRRSYL